MCAGAVIYQTICTTVGYRLCCEREKSQKLDHFVVITTKEQEEEKKT